MILSILAVIFGLVVLVWSADRFIDGAAATARYFGMPPLLIGMVIVGFGTSAPEIVVSVLSAMDGSPGIALGNAYGSNIANIALILGLTALISPIAVQRKIVTQEMPILLGITFLSLYLLWDKDLSLTDGVLMLVVLAVYMFWSVISSLKNKSKAAESQETLPEMSLQKGLFWLVLGLVILVLSSRLLVWGAVNIAQSMGVSDLVIGLTVVAVGTSLPELASSIAATRKGEHDIALGNVVGSNLFNTLAVVGMASVIHPMWVSAEILHRDVPIMVGLTLLLLIFCVGKQAKIGRVKGALLLAVFVGYTAYLISTAF